MQIAGPNGEPEPVWRYVKFFIYVPWPIAIPEHYWQVPTRRAEAGCGEQRLDWLADILPAPVAAEVARKPDQTFVYLRFHRIGLQIPRWLHYFHEVQRMAEGWDDFYRLRGRLPPGYAPWPVPETEPIATYGTVIEATTCLIARDGQNEGMALNDAFDRCLLECETFQEAYAQTRRDFRIGFINRATVLPMVPAVLMDPVTRATRRTGLTVNDQGAYPTEPPENATQDQATEIGLRSQLAAEGEPYVAIWHWRRLAFRARHVEGDYAASVVFTHTAGEVFFDSLLMRLAWEEIRSFRDSCLTHEIVAQWFSPRNPLSHRLRSEYHGRLEGGWDPDRPGNPIHDFDRKVSRLRNRIVHGGYRPTETEAEDAFAALLAAENYVFDMLVRDRNRTRYPFTTYMMVGKPRLEQRGLFNGTLRRSILDAPDDWPRSFYEFRRWVADKLTP